ncbi:GUN4 domain-containing protein [Kamptonema formosum]|uniref:GUN4 domain-containing protein n=1 Tax=Kamptonema formosum TaxID=331992 RepID=UPI00036944F6|nr:GUN4 domain-containing protein [Oscillatoria sp. PCC 10802]
MTVVLDYTHLRDLLAAGQWHEADKETRLLVLKAANCEKKEYLDGDDWLKFTSTDLKTIDQLWVHYSNGHFGFSVQKQIWLRVGGRWDADYDTYKKFCDTIDWRRGGDFVQKEEVFFFLDWLYEKDLIFNLKDSKKGHLPCDPICHYTWSGGRWNVGKGVWLVEGAGWVLDVGGWGWSLLSRRDL